MGKSSQTICDAAKDNSKYTERQQSEKNNIRILQYDDVFGSIYARQ
jgi:hypothetical protein